MSRAKKPKNALYSALEKALIDEMSEVTKKRDADDVNEEGKIVAKQGDYVYPTVERMRIYDRALKLEQVKLKMDDPEWSQAFRD
jgi:hypothetical protein